MPRQKQRNLQQLTLTDLQLRPLGANLSVGFLLGDLAIGLKADNQTDSVCKLLKILMKSETLRSPVLPVIGTERFQRRANAGITI